MGRTLTVALCLFVSACGGDPVSPDGGDGHDASMDAHAALDARTDAPAPTDAGTDAAVDGAASDPIFPLHVSPDAHHLVDASGRPFLLQGDSPWAIQNLSDADTLAYLDDRHARGLNAILIELVEHEFTAHTPPWADAAGNTPFADVNDFTTTQEPYFAHVDWVLERARERGILVLLVPAYIGYACGSEGWCAEMRTNGADTLRAYGQFVGARYRDQPNVVWVEGGDYTPTGGDLDLVNAVAAGIVEGDGGAHLHTGHWNRGTHSADVTEITFPLGLDASYTGGPPSYPQLESDVASQAGVRPVFVLENRYEGESGTAESDLRAQMYQPVLAGEAGFFFGSDPLWFLGESGDSNPGWTFGGGAYSDWRAALDGEGSRDDARAGAFFRSIAWDTLRPDTSHTVMTSGFGTHGDADYALCASSADGTLAVAYLPAHLSPVIDLSRFTAPVTATWFDPTNATRTVDAAALANTGTHVFTPPGANAAGDDDWVLLLEAS